MDVEDFKKKYEQLKDNPMYKNFCSILDTKSQVLERTAKENQELKQKLNWVAFGDDPELSLRYLRKIGYVDFDEERKVYINKHNNEPFLLKDEQEKDYYINDEELNEYTTQLEYKVKELKEQLDYLRSGEYLNQLRFERDMLQHVVNNSEVSKVDKEFIDMTHRNTELLAQQKEFIEYLEDYIDALKQQKETVEGLDIGEEHILMILEEVLEKYKGIIGGSNENNSI